MDRLECEKYNLKIDNDNSDVHNLMGNAVTDSDDKNRSDVALKKVVGSVVKKKYGGYIRNLINNSDRF